MGHFEIQALPIFLAILLPPFIGVVVLAARLITEYYHQRKREQYENDK